jgi:hypothetical protein
MGRGILTISIDLELAWGNWDNLSPYHIHNIETSERMIILRLLEIFDRYEIAVTWAFVAALLDQNSANNMPGPKELWYAPDIIDRICSSRVNHDLGSHGGRHRYFVNMTEKQAIEDLQFVSYIHTKNGFPLNSFVYPRNRVAAVDLLVNQGIKIYRGQDLSWHETIRNKQIHLGRVANFVDKMLPIAPNVVQPEEKNMILNLPGSMLFFGRKGLRRFVPPQVMLTKLEKGLHEAILKDGVFHLWFHPSNFWDDFDQQIKTFEQFIAKACELVSLGKLEVKPMNKFA